MQPGFKNISQYNNFVDPALISGAIQAVGQIGTAGINLANKDGVQGDVKAACGAKPITNFGGKKDAYLACAAAYSKHLASQQNYQNQSAAQLAQLQLLTQAEANKNKLSPIAITGIAVGSVAILGLLAFLIIK